MVDELSRIASDTLGEVLRTLLGSRSYRTVQPEREHDPPDGDDELPATAYAPQPDSRPWLGWLATAGRLLLSCVTHRGRPWWPSLVIAGAGIAALTGQPLLLAALAAARTWSRLRDEAREQMLNRPAHAIVGSDVLTDAVDLAIRNTAAAGVGNMITVQRMPLKDARPPEGSQPGWIIVNPPYGERLGEEEELIPLYRSLGERTAEHWPGWKLAVFTSNDFLARKVNLPLLRRSPFFNGAIPCHLWEFGG